MTERHKPDQADDSPYTPYVVTLGRQDESGGIVQRALRLSKVQHGQALARNVFPRMEAPSRESLAMPSDPSRRAWPLHAL